MDKNKIPTIEGNEKNLDRRSFLKLAGTGAVVTAGAISGVAAMAEQVLAQDITATSVSTETKSHLSPSEIMRKHAEAIPIGKDEYVENVLQEDKFVQGRYAKKSEDWKAEKAQGYFDSQFDSFIVGNDNGSLGRFVSRSPTFTSYILAFKDDFPLAGELEKEYKIADLRSERQASQARQQALKKLISLLSEHST